MELEKIEFSRKRNENCYKKKAEMIKILQTGNCLRVLSELNKKALASDSVNVLYDKGDIYNVFVEEGGVLNETDVFFPVNERFEMFEKFTRMLINNLSNSLVVVGKGGLGKSYTIKSELSKKGLIEDVNFKFMRGHCTPFELYKTCYDYNDRIIIFDDCDSILGDTTSMNILKNACDDCKERMMSWGSSAAEKADYPKEFEFTGRIIIISNKNKDYFDEAFKTRSTIIDLAMTTEEKLERMGCIATDFASENDFNIIDVHESLDFLNKNKSYCENLSMRSLKAIINIINSGEKNWERMALYKLINEQ